METNTETQYVNRSIEELLFEMRENTGARTTKSPYVLSPPAFH